MAMIFKGALVGDEHTLRDWGAIITNTDVIGIPEPQTILLDVPGRSGRLDLSEVLTGDISYGNREIKMELAAEKDSEGWQEMCHHIFNKYHGRNVRVVFDDDPSFYYYGRVSVTDPKRLRRAGQMVLTVDAEPFKYELAETNVTYSAGTASLSGTLANGRMMVSPTVTVSAPCQLYHEGKIYTLTAGKQSVPGFVLHEGDNAVSLTGTRSATFTYRRGWI